MHAELELSCGRLSYVPEAHGAGCFSVEDLCLAFRVEVEPKAARWRLRRGRGCVAKGSFLLSSVKVFLFVKLLFFWRRKKFNKLQVNRAH